MATALADRIVGITVDITMPDMDGWDIIRALGENPITSEIPVIVCSIVSDQTQAAALGVETTLVKPILKEDLINALDGCRQVGIERRGTE